MNISLGSVLFFIMLMGGDGRALIENQPKPDLAGVPVCRTDGAAAPDLQALAGKINALCKKHYPPIIHKLIHDGFQPPQQVVITEGKRVCMSRS